MLKLSHDKTEGAYRSCWGWGRRVSYVTPDLSYCWEGARQQCKDDEWDGEKKGHRSGYEGRI